MSKKGKAAVWVLALSVVCGLIIWHVIYWHCTGMYLEMFKWLQTGRGYITAFYNLGLMLVLGSILGLLTQKTADLAGHDFDAKKTYSNNG